MNRAWMILAVVGLLVLAGCQEPSAPENPEVVDGDAAESEDSAFTVGEDEPEEFDVEFDASEYEY